MIAILLTKMREMAESYSGDKIEDAIVSVPAYFDNLQK
jgi:molecular chaperone DnaK (HSP70)